MKFTLRIEMDNAAFDGEPAMELARILRHAAEMAEDGLVEMVLRDHNGNKVGEAAIE